MASDGCQQMPRAHYPVYGVRGWYAYDEAGAGGHNSSGHQSHGARAQPAAGPPRHHSSGNTGTWAGPAPRGNPNLVPFSQTKMSDAPVRPRPTPGKTAQALPGGGLMPLLALSCEGPADVVAGALTAGYRHLDCSPEFNNQTEVGRSIAASGVKREELFVASKLANEDHGDAAAACKKTLAELGLAQLDLFYIGWPVALKKGTQEVDTACTLEDTWKQMEALVEAGLVKYIGLANFDLPQIEKVLACAAIKPAVLQIETHPLLAQRKLVGVCNRYGLAVVAHHPLGDGSLATLPASEEAGKMAGQSATRAALRWNVQRRIAVVVPGTDAAQVKDAAGAIEFCFFDEEKRILDRVDAHTRFVQPSFMTFADPEQGGAVKPSVVLGY